MKKWLKITLRIAFPFIFCLYVYLFFIDEEANRMEQFWGLPFFAGAIAGGAHLYCKKDSLVLKILCAISLGILLLWISIICVVSIISPIMCLISSFGDYHRASVFGLSLILLSFLSCIIFFLAVRNTYLYSIISRFRLLSHFLIKITPITIYLLAIYIATTSNNVWAYLTAVISWMPTCLLYYLLYKHKFFNNTVYAVDSKKYVLYLRSFCDDDIDFIPLKNIYERVIKIGNPQIAYSSDDFFLPSKNWKRYLDYYIQRADIIYINLSNTNGVRWELMHHKENLSKYVFIVREKARIEKLLSTLLIENNDDSDPLIDCLKTVLKNKELPDFFTFTITGDFYSGYQINKDSTPILHINVKPLTTKRVSLIKKIRFYFMDIKRASYRFFKMLKKKMLIEKGPIFFGVLLSVGALLFIICMFIVGVISLVTGLINIFWPIEDIGYSTTELILIGIFGISGGIEMLKGSSR